MSFRTQILLLASTFHKGMVLSFGYAIPALSSVKAVVRRDSEAYHQWTCYWLILHLYLYILSPIFHISLHPIFQIIAILWLSLPQYQGALVVYDKLVNPFVDQYERSVDDAVEEAHRGVRRWLWTQFGGVIWLLISESGSLVASLINIAMMMLGISDGLTTTMSSSGSTISSVVNSARQQHPAAKSAEQLHPRHSVKESLRQFPSFEVGSSGGHGENNKFDPKEIADFLAMLRQGLYVFANVSHTNDDNEDNDVYEMSTSERYSFEGGFKLGIFSFAKDAFIISPVAAAGSSSQEDVSNASPIKLHVGNLMPLHPSGSQGLVLECNSVTPGTKYRGSLRAEIVLSDEIDRDILLNGLNACLPHILSNQ